jgi:rod shape-determining protein MreC
MRHKQRFLSVFILFVTLSLFLFVLSKSPAFPFVRGLVEQLVLPAQRLSYALFGRVLFFKESQELATLKTENARLLKLVIDQKDIERENQALQDQFAEVKIPTRQLLPAQVIGLQSSTSQPAYITLDKGTSEGAKKGMVVVYKDILIGKIAEATAHMSVVELLTNKNTKLAARTTKTGALGIITGQEDGVLLDNVLLSEKLEKGDIIVTKGDITKEGLGSPPDLVIGKIIAVHKEASALFQTADVQPVLDVTRLPYVFILLPR